MQRQFVASVYIIAKERVLLIYHRKLQKWLPAGGHVDPNELPSEAAIREAFEETGMEVELLSDEHLWVDRWNAKSFPRPFLCLLEEIPAYKEQPAHQHIDNVYIGRTIGGHEKINETETEGLRWFSWEEIQDLEDDQDIFAETKSVLQSIFNYLSREEPCVKKLSSSPLPVSM
jgi:8-oxo-dGTP pyrophosphatase MutT (NUDIX family)